MARWVFRVAFFLHAGLLAAGGLTEGLHCEYGAPTTPTTYGDLAQDVSREFEANPDHLSVVVCIYHEEDGFRTVLEVMMGRAGAKDADAETEALNLGAVRIFFEAQSFFGDWSQTKSAPTTILLVPGLPSRPDSPSAVNHVVQHVLGLANGRANGLSYRLRSVQNL